MSLVRTPATAFQFQIPEFVQTVVFWGLHSIFRVILFCCVKVRKIEEFPLDLPPGFILATNHNSHLDAHLLGSIVPRKVDWLSRIEFFKNKWSALALHLVSAIPIHRQGVPVKAIRTAILRLRKGRNIGICPEGEVREGPQSVIYGGKIKRGVALLAWHTGAPVLPCVVLGVEQLCRIEPWLPMRRGKVWANFGQPIYIRKNLPKKEAREILCLEVESQMRELFTRMREGYAVSDRFLP